MITAMTARAVQPGISLIDVAGKISPEQTDLVLTTLVDLEFRTVTIIVRKPNGRQVSEDYPLDETLFRYVA